MKNNQFFLHFLPILVLFIPQIAFAFFHASANLPSKPSPAIGYVPSSVLFRNKDPTNKVERGIVTTTPVSCSLYPLHTFVTSRSRIGRAPIQWPLYSSEGSIPANITIVEVNSTTVQESTDTWKTKLKRIKLKLLPQTKNSKEPLRQRLMKLGLTVFLSYGWISNIFSSITISCAWFVSSKRSGLSPLAPGQWKPFLGVYAGFYVVSSLFRPLRVAMAMGVSPFFDKAVNYFQKRFKVQQSAAIFIVVFLANIVGTTILTTSGVMLASLLSGVPVFVT